MGLFLGSTGHLSANTCFGQLEREPLKTCSSLPVDKLIFREHELFGDLNDSLFYTRSIWVKPNSLCFEFKASGLNMVSLWPELCQGT